MIRHYPNDAAGFFWHHRVLLQKCSPGVWIALTPDGDLERIDLGQVDHITLDRRSLFPPAQAPYTYAFDDMTKTELEMYRRRARTTVNLFNDADFQEVDAFEWVVGDTSRPDFGEPISAELIENGVTLRDSGIVEKDGDEVFVVRIAVAEKEQWITSKEATKGDLRLLGDFRDSQGRRYLSFSESVDKLRSSSMDDWPLSPEHRIMITIKILVFSAIDLEGKFENQDFNQYFFHAKS